MQQPLVFTIVLLLSCIAGVAGIVALVVWQFRWMEAEHAAYRRDALAQFAAWQASPAAAQLRLTPDLCEVVKESDTVGRYRSGPVYSYTLTLFLHNRDGNYYMFKSTPGGPYIQLVSAEAAKVVLKQRYVSSEPGQ